MWTTDNDHGAQLQFHTGRHALEGAFPTIGSWVHYGLGTLNENLPQFVVLGTPLGRLLRRQSRPRQPLPRAGARRRPPERRPEEPAAVRRPAGGQVRRGAEGRVRPARQAQPAGRHRVPGRPGAAGADQVVRTGLPHADGGARRDGLRRRRPTRRRSSTASTTRRRKPFGQQCLAARRLVERGVRFVQVFHGSTAAPAPGTRTAT